MSGMVSYRRDLYHAFSELLKEPANETIQELPDIVAFVAEAFSVLNCPAPPELLQDWPVPAAELAALTKAYCQSFYSPSETRVLPLESVYRPWTNDQSATMPGAHDRGYLLSDAAVHMLALYDIYGLTLPESYHASPDHLCLQLEFAAHLIDLGQEDRLQIFLAEHLDWVQELSADAAKAPIAPFYRRVIALTARFLDHEATK